MTDSADPKLAFDLQLSSDIPGAHHSNAQRKLWNVIDWRGSHRGQIALSDEEAAALTPVQPAATITALRQQVEEKTAGWAEAFRLGVEWQETALTAEKDAGELREQLASLTQRVKEVLEQFVPPYEMWMDDFLDDARSGLYRVGTFGQIRAARALHDELTQETK